MAQIAIPLVVVGVLFLLSNDKKETFEINEKDEIVKNSVEKISIETNNEGVYSQYQDKYIDRSHKKNSFVSLTGQRVDEFKHNNMNVFYNNKSNGEFSQGRYNKVDSTMDNYTGAGSLNINKEEVCTFFKPQENMQNVYGNQNQSDFMQSRVVQSQKFSNSKPWEEVKVAPGTSGFNSGMERREQWIDKNVDGLRAANNPKANNPTNYVPPAYKMGDRGIQGKVIKKSPEKFHVYNEIRGNAMGVLKPTQNSEQMLTDENREHTSTSYFGTRASDAAGYVKGSYDEPHKPELPTNPYLNLTSNEIFPTSEQNYGKSSYKSYNNNRNTESEYLGSVKGLFMANVVNPIVNGLKHTKKEDLTCNPFNGNLSATTKPSVQTEIKIPATNRQIQADRIGTNYLQMNRQNSDGYMTANPYLIGQQRTTTESSYVGTAGGLAGAKSYNAEYNQREFEKPSENRMPSGNRSLFNNKMNVTINSNERNNERAPALYNPSVTTFQQIGMNTTSPNEYRNVNDDYLQADMLKAFKQNPYTKPIGSVA